MNMKARENMKFLISALTFITLEFAGYFASPVNVTKFLNGTNKFDELPTISTSTPLGSTFSTFDRQYQQQYQQTKESDEFAESVLLAHNTYRLVFGVPPLVLNNKLNSLACKLAEKASKFRPVKDAITPNVTLIKEVPPIDEKNGTGYTATFFKDFTKQSTLNGVRLVKYLFTDGRKYLYCHDLIRNYNSAGFYHKIQPLVQILRKETSRMGICKRYDEGNTVILLYDNPEVIVTDSIGVAQNLIPPKLNDTHVRCPTLPDDDPMLRLLNNIFSVYNGVNSTTTIVVNVTTVVPARSSDNKTAATIIETTKKKNKTTTIDNVSNNKSNGPVLIVNTTNVTKSDVDIEQDLLRPSGFIDDAAAKLAEKGEEEKPDNIIRNKQTDIVKNVTLIISNLVASDDDDDEQPNQLLINLTVRLAVRHNETDRIRNCIFVKNNGSNFTAVSGRPFSFGGNLSVRANVTNGGGGGDNDSIRFDEQDMKRFFEATDNCNDRPDCCVAVRRKLTEILLQTVASGLKEENDRPLKIGRRAMNKSSDFIVKTNATTTTTTLKPEYKRGEIINAASINGNNSLLKITTSPSPVNESGQVKTGRTINVVNTTGSSSSSSTTSGGLTTSVIRRDENGRIKTGREMNKKTDFIVKTTTTAGLNKNVQRDERKIGRQFTTEDNNNNNNNNNDNNELSDSDRFKIGRVMPELDDNDRANGTGQSIITRKEVESKTGRTTSFDRRTSEEIMTDIKSSLSENMVINNNPSDDFFDGDNGKTAPGLSETLFVHDSNDDQQSSLSLPPGSAYVDLPFVKGDDLFEDCSAVNKGEGFVDRGTNSTVRYIRLPPFLKLNNKTDAIGPLSVIRRNRVMPEDYTGFMVVNSSSNNNNNSHLYDGILGDNVNKPNDIASVKTDNNNDTASEKDTLLKLFFGSIVKRNNNNKFNNVDIIDGEQVDNAVKNKTTTNDSDDDDDTTLLKLFVRSKMNNSNVDDKAPPPIKSNQSYINRTAAAGGRSKDASVVRDNSTSSTSTTKDSRNNNVTHADSVESIDHGPKKFRQYIGPVLGDEFATAAEEPHEEERWKSFNKKGINEDDDNDNNRRTSTTADKETGGSKKNRTTTGAITKQDNSIRVKIWIKNKASAENNKMDDEEIITTSAETVPSSRSSRGGKLIRLIDSGSLIDNENSASEDYTSSSSSEECIDCEQESSSGNVKNGNGADRLLPVNEMTNGSKARKLIIPKQNRTTTLLRVVQHDR